MQNLLRFVAASSGLFLLTLAHAAGIDGKWKAEFETQIGVQKYVFEFKIAGATATGKASFERQDQKGEVDLKEIKVTNDQVSFVEMLKFQNDEIRIDYTGKITGDELKLTRKVGDFATEELVAKRVKP